MKIIFDISVIAWFIRSNKAKAGIFRVIENLLNGLLNFEGQSFKIET